MTNKELAKDLQKAIIKLTNAGFPMPHITEATRRQASKFRNGHGLLAWAIRLALKTPNCPQLPAHIVAGATATTRRSPNIDSLAAQHKWIQDLLAHRTNALAKTLSKEA